MREDPLGVVMSRAIARGPTVAAVVIVLVVLVGVAIAAGVLGAPRVTGVRNRFAGVNRTTTLVETAVAIDNPNPVGVRLGSLAVDYTVRLNDVAIANGSRRGLDVPAGNSTLTLTTAMNNDRIPTWWVTHIRNGEHTTMRVDATVHSGLLGRSIEATPVTRSVDTDILSAFNSTATRPIDAHNPLISDPVLYVNETTAAWGDVSNATTPIDMTFTVYDPKPAPYTVTKVGYVVTMNGVSVGRGETARGVVVPPHTPTTVDATTVIQNDRLPDWWVTHLRRGQVTTLRITFVATVRLPGGREVSVPLRALTYRKTFRTDFFGTGGTAIGDVNASSTPAQSRPLGPLSA